MTIGTVMTAYPIFQQHYAYKVSHVYTHHPKLGNPDADPDLQFFVEEKVYTATPRNRYFNRIVVWPALGKQTVAYLRYLIRNRFLVLEEEHRIKRCRCYRACGIPFAVSAPLAILCLLPSS